MVTTSLIFQSRSIWNRPLELLHEVRHGENSKNHNILLYQDTVKQDPSERSRTKPSTEFYDEYLEQNNEDWIGMLLNETSPESTQFTNDTTVDLLDCDSVMRQNEAESSGVFYGPNAVIQIKAEETVDISRLLFNTSDEAFSIGDSELPCEVNIKDITSFCKHGNNMHNLRNIKRYENNNSSDQLLSSVNVGNLDIISVDDGFYSHNDNPILDKVTSSSDNSVANNASIYDPVYNNVFWGDTSIVDSSAIINTTFETPDNSRSPINIADSKSSGLTLNFHGIPLIADEINTPNIIDEIIENERIDFSTPKTTGGKIILTTYTPEIKEESSTSEVQVAKTYADVSSLEESVASGTQDVVIITGKRPPKRVYQYDDESNSEDDDDDVDYTPPAKSKPVKRKTAAVAYEDESVFKVGKRGRPPKRNQSISSDDYSQLDPSEARYREMRDRNNEASRKSRYKRKHKEVAMSQEMREMEMENIKLKTQVEELQKTVDSYRDNLMKVMLSKK